MNFNEYQEKALTTDVFDESERNINSRAFFAKLLGLVGETGEVAEKFKKIYRDNDGEMTEEQRKNMEKELGDILWYVSTVAAYLGLSLDDIARLNIEKLLDRKNRGKIGGSGDNR